jgi:hypothetical protein
MKKFILHISLLIVLIIVSIALVLNSAGGNIDAFYLKVSSPQEKNLIIGISKAAQGIQPERLKQILDSEFYNFAFAIYASPYGNVYLENIKKKLDKQKQDQTFILTIDPWSICSEIKNPNDSLNFRENKYFLNNISNVTQYPNFEYLIRHFDGKYYKIFVNNSPAYLHDDGWLEVNLDEEVESVERRTDYTIDSYQEKINSYQYSNVRYFYLLKTIDYLKDYGKVYLVRLPVHYRLYEIENHVMSSFDDEINSAINRADGYLDLTPFNKEYQYTDGVHLNKKSGIEVTELIAEWIKSKE